MNARGRNDPQLTPNAPPSDRLVPSLKHVCSDVERGRAPRELGSRGTFADFGLTSGHAWAGMTTGGFGSPVNYYYALGGLVHFLAPESVLEIGTGFGLGSATIVRAGGASLRRLVSIDLNEYHDVGVSLRGNLDFARARVESWLASRAGALQCEFVVGNTQPDGTDNEGTPSAAPRWRGEGIPDGSLDLLFVDGKHTGDGALNDLRTFWPKLRPGGVVLVDDLHDETLDRAHAAHRWCGDVWRSFFRFIEEQRANDPLEHFVWRYPRVGSSAEDERPWGLLRKPCSDRREERRA